MVLAGLVGSVVTFLVSLLIGGLGIYVGARVMTGDGDFERAVWTALFAALGVGVVSLLVGWIPLLGGLLATVLGFLVYLGIINWRYPGGWIDAAGIALIAWLASVIVLTLVSRLLPGGVGALGVAGV
ncbi:MULTISPECIES: hypothetical protein [Halomicrobium]|uniref:Uncharacterized protein n=2 Tax=Halomicrobium mukohataei TaxID=57705 RepID=C7NXV1_HALMD|nr:MULTISPECIES: hypothetical protein [Halomicrobium]ACV46539.1 conserved hypothetical protein [Halomicrobium mukohataei DSM 12286]QCD65082.1 hypothetical protein E5139_05295 [Halomicrobium mukohataei]QFR19888.1 hypothetical protein GBQ70_05290 [Halomicrobium sp. ZPS1]